jgi:hypothetical protein
MVKMWKFSSFLCITFKWKIEKFVCRWVEKYNKEHEERKKLPEETYGKLEFSNKGALIEGFLFK